MIPQVEGKGKSIENTVVDADIFVLYLCRRIVNI
jgi:hypothetical protein